TARRWSRRSWELCWTSGTPPTQERLGPPRAARFAAAYSEGCARHQGPALIRAPGRLFARDHRIASTSPTRRVSGVGRSCGLDRRPPPRDERNRLLLELCGPRRRGRPTAAYALRSEWFHRGVGSRGVP